MTEQDNTIELECCSNCEWPHGPSPTCLAYGRKPGDKQCPRNEDVPLSGLEYELDDLEPTIRGITNGGLE